MEKENSIMTIKNNKKITQLLQRGKSYNQKEISPTNSTGNTEHFLAMVTFLSGEAITAFGAMC